MIIYLLDVICVFVIDEPKSDLIAAA